ncbi:putative Mitogen-activated protein kinase kinase kinase 1 [Hypsibius exemplaris]|uniref:Mitogen-activated protein kinase kinase kinase 1 n=1 Tax=Hypsibius exemplaris TaxID=2072580 RepID=A0A1W0WQA6_HYPEX|nr:putative Mitogen-activated protein kinase kinase kinase 1 [Hypsibius exemplaris]
MANEDSDYRERLRSMVIHIANHGEHIDQEGKTKTETKMYHCLPAGNEILGSGSYGYVMRARLVCEKDLCECPDGDVALKFLNNEPSEGRMSELRLMLNIDHDNVVKCLAVGYCTDSSGDPRLKGSPKREACIMMEYCDGGTLENFIAANPLSEERLFDYTSQLSKGLHYLHEQEKDSGILLVFHGDLKTQNILLKDKIGSVLKIAGLDDFKKLEQQRTMCRDLKRKMGTLALMSPEMIAWEKDKPILRVGRATDIWSLGCVILECFQGGGPFNFRKTDNSFVDGAELSDDEIMTIVDEGGVPDIPDTMPVALRRLVESCLSRDPSERPNALALRLYAENLKVFEENTVQRNLVLLQKTKARKKYLLLPDKMPYFINSTRIVEYVFAGERGSYVLMEGYYADVLLVHMKEKDWSNDSTGPDLKCTVVILRHPLQARGAEELQHLITLDHQNVGKYYSLGCTHSNNDESMGDLSLDWRYILMENYSGQCMTNHPSLQDAIQAESYAHQLILGMNYINARVQTHMSIAEEEPDLYSESHKCDHPYIRMEKHYGEQDYLVISSPDGVVHRFDAGTPEMMLHSILSDAIFCSQFSGNVRTLTLPATFSTDEQCARQKEAMFIYGNFGFQVSLKQQFQTMTRIADFQHENIVRHFTFGIQRLTDVSPTSRNNYGLLLEHGFRSDPGIMFGQTFLDLHTLVGFAVLSSKTILKYTLQLLDAVEYLHEREPRFIIGRLKTSSIAVTPDRQSVKIFDLLAPLYRPSTYLKSEHSVRSVLKTHGYFHPLLFEKFSPDQHEDAREEQHELVFTKGSDFWAFGCVVIDMISGGNLQHIDRKGVYLKKDIRRMKFAEEMILGGQPEIPETSPHFLRSFCEECFNRYPEVELTAAHLRTVLSHELLADKI